MCMLATCTSIALDIPTESEYHQWSIYKDNLLIF